MADQFGSGKTTRSLLQKEEMSRRTHGKVIMGGEHDRGAAIPNLLHYFEWQPEQGLDVHQVGPLQANNVNDRAAEGPARVDITKGAPGSNSSL
jgi:hypothetical protein